jgi:capsular polysaccharide biosynthesis protein
MDNYFSNMNLVRIFLKWKWHLLAIVAIAAVIAVVLSSPLVIKPRFRSSAVLYPSNVAPYSDESETEQMLQWFNSRDIMDSIMLHYDLPAHYGISRDHKHFQSVMQYMYNRNVRISKTQFESVNIDVLDTDPVRARDMVNSIIDFYNKKIRQIHREKYAEVVASYKNMIDLKQSEIDSVLHQHYILRTEYGIIDYNNQTREIARGHLRTVDGTNAQHINTDEVARLKANIEEKGGEFILYNARIYTLVEQLGNMYKEYDDALMHYTKEFTYTNIVSHPTVPDKKATPIRWLILLYTVVAAAFFSVVVIALIENSRSMQEKVSAKEPSE